MVIFTTENKGLNVMSVVVSSLKIHRRMAIAQDRRELIDRLLLEKISLAGIARAAKVSERWLQTYVNDGGFWVRIFLPKTRLKNMLSCLEKSQSCQKKR